MVVCEKLNLSKTLKQNSLQFVSLKQHLIMKPSLFQNQNIWYEISEINFRETANVNKSPGATFRRFVLMEISLRQNCIFMKILHWAKVIEINVPWNKMVLYLFYSRIFIFIRYLLSHTGDTSYSIVIASTQRTPLYMLGYLEVTANLSDLRRYKDYFFKCTLLQFKKFSI